MSIRSHLVAAMVILVVGFGANSFIAGAEKGEAVRPQELSTLLLSLRKASMFRTAASCQKEEPPQQTTSSPIYNVYNLLKAPRFELLKSGRPKGISFHSDGRVGVRIVGDANVVPPQAFTEPDVVDFGAFKQIVVPSKSHRPEEGTTRVRYYEDNEIQYEATVSNDLLNYILADAPERFSAYHGEQMKPLIQNAAERHGHHWWRKLGLW